MSTPIRLLLVDDQELVRAGFAMVLDSCDDIEVVGQASDGDDALRFLEHTRVDVVLMDVRIVVLTTFDLDEAVASAIGAGASGFLLKDVAPEALIDAVRTVYRGDSVVDPVSTRRLLRRTAPLLAEPAPSAPSAALPGDLTPREHEILVLIGQGRTNSEIAAELVVSEATVKTHVGHVLAKTGSRDRVQAVALAFRAGLVN